MLFKALIGQGIVSQGLNKASSTCKLKCSDLLLKIVRSYCYWRHVVKVE